MATVPASVDVTGTSRRSVDDAIRDGLARAGLPSRTPYRLTNVRARVLDGDVEQFEVALSCDRVSLSGDRT